MLPQLLIVFVVQLHHVLRQIEIIKFSWKQTTNGMEKI